MFPPFRRPTSDLFHSISAPVPGHQPQKLNSLVWTSRAHLAGDDFWNGSISSADHCSAGRSSLRVAASASTGRAESRDIRESGEIGERRGLVSSVRPLLLCFFALPAHSAVPFSAPPCHYRKLYAVQFHSCLHSAGQTIADGIHSTGSCAAAINGNRAGERGRKRSVPTKDPNYALQPERTSIVPRVPLYRADPTISLENSRRASSAAGLDAPRIYRLRGSSSFFSLHNCWASGTTSNPSEECRGNSRGL